MRARQIRQFLALVFAVEKGGDSGVLDVRSSAERALLYFRDGKLVFVEQSSLGKTLGAYLVDQGLLTRLQYQTIVASLAGTTPASPMMAFMERAICERVLDAAMANAILGAQVERNFIRCLGWEHEYSQFDPQERVLEGQPVFPCSLTLLTLQGLQTHLSQDEANAELERYAGRRPAFFKAIELISREFRLHPRLERNLRELDEATSFDGPKGLAPDLRTLLIALVYTSRMRFVSEDSASASGRHPKMVGAADAPDVGRLRFTLPTPPSAEEVEAAAAFQRGKHQLEDDPDAACAELRRASMLVSRPDYNLYATWAEFHIAADATRDALRGRLEDATRLALENDSTFSFGYFVVGQLHLAYGDKESAALSFERAVSLDPNNELAVRALNALRDRFDTA